MKATVVNGVSIAYKEYGSGEPVVLVAGSGERSRIWDSYQVPALTRSGYRVVIFDNRGVSSSDEIPGDFTIDDMVADTVGLIEALRLDPCRVVGFSLGAMIVQELLLAYPVLVTDAVLVATRGRVDALRKAISAAQSDLLDGHIELPPRYAAVVRAMQYLSPRTQNDEQRIRDWLDIFEMSPPDYSINRAQRCVDITTNRLEEYRKIRSRCLVIGFHDDLITPPYLCREVANSIPGCRYEEVVGCGHYGHLEQPDAINSLIINFFRERRPFN